MAEQARAIAEASLRPNVRIRIIPWITPVAQFPRGGFHLYDDTAVHVATAIIIITAPADIATYTEIFTDLEEIASFGDAAPRAHRRQYERLCAGQPEAPTAAAGVSDDLGWHAWRTHF
jgi:hypothetical protein